MTDKTYKCEECDKEVSVSWVRFHQLINATYDLQTKNNKLIKFVKEISTYSTCKYDYCPIPKEAKELLQELGEL